MIHYKTENLIEQNAVDSVESFQKRILSLKYFWNLYSFLHFFVFSDSKAFPRVQNSKIINLELRLGSNELWFRVRIYR